MTTSDSENFESADEDLDVNTNKPSNKKTAEQKGNVDESCVKSTLSGKDDENNMVKKTRTESTDEDFRELSAGEASNREKKKERPTREPIERKPKQAMKLGVKIAEKSQAGASKPTTQSTSEINKEATVEKPPEELKSSINTSNAPKTGIAQKPEEDLSDNDWNDFDIDPKSEDSKKSDDNLAVKSASHNVKPDKDKDEDGWDDGFEDWGEEDPKDHISSNCSVQHSDTEYKALADRLSSLGQGDTTPGGSGAGSGSWGGWGGWGANLLSSGVSQLTSHVSQGFTTVSNVIESGMGAPDPEELVRIQRASRERIEKELMEEQSKTDSSQKDNTSCDNIKEDSTKSVQQQRSTEEVDDSNALGVFKFGKLVSSVTKLVETTGTAVVSGGLDTLEEIGKRTMRVIQGDEPGGRVQLSTLLREARDRVDEGPPKMEDEDKNRNKKAPRFEALFDDFQGLVHLEALEMLSRQCDMKIKTLLSKVNGTELIELKETLNQVKEICELPDPDDEDDDSDGKLDVETFRAKLQEATKDLGVPLNFEAILKCWEEILNDSSQPLKSESNSTEPEKPVEPDMGEAAEKLSHTAISNLARCSALSVQLLHKSTALLSVRERRSTADEADGLTQLTAVLSSHIGEVAAVYSQKLHQMAQICKDKETVNEFITNIFLEARKGSSYLQDAFLLTIPILQVGAT